MVTCKKISAGESVVISHKQWQQGGGSTAACLLFIISKLIRGLTSLFLLTVQLHSIQYTTTMCVLECLRHFLCVPFLYYLQIVGWMWREQATQLATVRSKQLLCMSHYFGLIVKIAQVFPCICYFSFPLHGQICI